MPYISPQRKIVAWFHMISGGGSLLLMLIFLLIGETQSPIVDLMIASAMLALYGFTGYGLLKGFKYFWGISLITQFLEIITIESWELNLGYHISFTLEDSASYSTYGFNLTAVLFCYLLFQARQKEGRHTALPLSNH